MAIDPVTVFVAGFVVVLAQALVFGYAFAKYANLFARLGMITRPLGLDRWAGVAALFVFLTGFAWLTIAGTFPTRGNPRESRSSSRSSPLASACSASRSR